MIVRESVTLILGMSTRLRRIISTDSSIDEEMEQLD